MCIWRRIETTYSVDTLQEGITKDIKVHGSTGLDTSIDHTVTGISEAQVLLLNSKLLATNGEGDNWKIVYRSVGWEDVTLLGRVVCGTWNGIIDGLAGCISDQSKGGSGIDDSSVAGLSNGRAVDGGRGRVDSPETLGVVNWSVGDLLSRSCDDSWVNEAESVEADSLIGVVSIAP